MQTLAMTTVLVLASFTYAKADNNVTVQPVSYTKIQKGVRSSARVAAEQAQTMARLALQGRRDASTQAAYAADLKVSVNQVLNRASQLALTLPYETFNSAEGNQLQQAIFRLASSTDATIQFMNETPNRLQSGQYQNLLKQVQDACEEIAE